MCEKSEKVNYKRNYRIMTFTEILKDSNYKLTQFNFVEIQVAMEYIEKELKHTEKLEL